MNDRVYTGVFVDELRFAMDEVITFIVQNWQLSSVFAVLLVAYLIFELRQKDSSQKAITPQETVRLYNHEKGHIIDIRSEGKFKGGHIVGSIRIDKTKFSTELNKLSKFKKTPVVIVCDLGRESVKFSPELEQEGFDQVFYLAGGIQAWKDAGLPLTTKG